MDHLDASALFEIFAEGSAGAGSRREAAEEHLDGCEDCRALVAAYARISDDSDTLADAPPVSPYSPTMLSDHPPGEPGRASPGDLIAGRYLLLHVVGEGGMGVVWAARDLRSDRQLALKVLKLDTPEVTRRVLREAHVSAVISHPNVARVHEILTPEGSPPILVMDLLQGESLDRLLARRAPLPVAETAALLLPLIAAVRTAHLRGVLHRDLKPQNVFLAREDPSAEPVVILLDFGLAKLIGQDVEVLTRTGAIVGTPHYMAPEQLYGERAIDRRADVWAIGALAYECLTGKRPLEGSSYAQLVRSASRRANKPLATLLPGAPPVLVSIVDRMLSHDREARPELAEVHAVLDALAR